MEYFVLTDAFEFDDDKSKSNLVKHGIDFQTAQGLWEDPDLLEIQVASENEHRFLVIGCMGQKHWPAVVTYRNERIRLISVRQSRKSEVALYESQGFR